MPRHRLIPVLKRHAWALLVLAWPATAAAHMRTSTFSQLSLGAESSTWDVKISVLDLLGPLGLDENLSPGDALLAVRGRRDLVERYVGSRLSVFAGHVACGQKGEDFTVNAADEPPTLQLRFVYTCPLSESRLRARYELFFDLDPLHSGFVNVSLAGAPAVSDVFRSNNRELSVALQTSLWRSLRQFWWLGVEHIFTGYDHLAFLAGLLLLACVRKRPGPNLPMEPASTRAAFLMTAKIVTAFTASHSLTLIAAVLRPELVPTRFVEPVIAASVAAVGVENLLPRMPQRRWLVAFVFGLVHGFGFASVLSEIGLPSNGLVAALLAFNVGVECGQLSVVLFALPLLLFVAKRWPQLYHRVFLFAGSAALVVAGTVWFAQRL